MDDKKDIRPLLLKDPLLLKNQASANSAWEAKYWDGVLSRLEEQMQFGFLTQARAVTATELSGSILQLTVSTPEAKNFFSQAVNQRRLLIILREVPLEITEIAVQIA